MSTLAHSPTAPIEKRDLRSDAMGAKRDKEHNQKWMNGQRPSSGVAFRTLPGGLPADSHGGSNDQQRQKVRPMKQWSSEPKSHANKVLKPSGHYDSSRLLHKAQAVADVNDHTSSSLSESLLELLPQHANNTQSAIQTAIRGSTDAGILYSFDNKGPSPGSKGRNVDLGGLVELAEQKWAAEQTEKIIKGEYEVLDIEGETTVLTNKKKKGSPKQAVKAVEPVEDEGFELI